MSYFKQDNDMIKLSWELQNNVGRRWGIIPNEADLIEQHHFYNQYTGAEVGTGEGNGTHSSTLAWKIPWTEEPGRLRSMGMRRVGHD